MLFSCHSKPTGKLHIHMTTETNICHLFVFSDHLQLDMLGLLSQKSLNNGQHPGYNMNALQSLLWTSTCYLWALVWPSQKPTQRTSSFSTLSQSVSSVAQSCPTLCDPMNCSMPGFPVHHQLPEFTKIHVHWAAPVSHWSLPDKHVISAWWAMWSVPDQPRHQCMRSHVISAW